MEDVGEYQYNAKDIIGHGAFAVVYRGRSQATPSRTVAIKSITKKNIAKSQMLLDKEIKILKELTALQHENVVALLDCMETSTHVFLVMEFCNGGDLADYLSGMGTLSEDTIRLFLKQIAAAMKALHTKGVVHRDLKPQNILLCYKSEKSKNSKCPNDIILKIADFGFARFLSDGVMAATLCGSPMYMAPEVIMSLAYDAKSDLWSIGTIVYQCHTGKAPFQAHTPQALKQYYEKNPDLAPNIPNGTSKELKDLLLKLLKRNAKDRINFEQFFDHPFMKPISKPLAVPRLGDQSHSPASNCSPQSPNYYGSPLMMQLDAANSSARDSGTPVAGSSESSEEQVDDFVIVHKPANTAGCASGRMASSPSGRTLPEPVPVPTQRENYEKIQKTRQAARTRKDSGQTVSEGDKVSSLTSNGSDGSPKTYAPDVAQLTPPDVQFVIGTPPGHRGLCSSLVRRQSAPILNANIASGQHAANMIQRQHTPPFTLPVNSFENRESNIPAPFPWTIRNTGSPLGSPVGQRRSVNYLPSINRAITFCEGTQLHPHGPHTAPTGTHFCQGHGQFGHYSAQRSSCCYHASSATTSGGGTGRPISIPYASPPDFDDGIHFIPPELPAETLLDREHNEILAKLNFALTLVECIMTIAETRSSPIKILTESTGKKVIPTMSHHPHVDDTSPFTLFTYLLCCSFSSTVAIRVLS